VKPELERFLAAATRPVADQASEAKASNGRIISLAEVRAAHHDGAEPWSLDELRGRLVELSGAAASATLSAAFGVVLEVQQAGEPAAWITAVEASFYPPDAISSGVDLAALVVVRLAESAADRFLLAAARASERLLRSGGFGLVVIDLTSATPHASTDGEPGRSDLPLPVAAQGRLVSLAQTHDAAIVCVTAKPDDAGSLGSLVSLHVAALRTLGERDPVVTLRALKDKRRGPRWSRTVKVRGPSGY
jgi:recombination protein RecA